MPDIRHFGLFKLTVKQLALPVALQPSLLGEVRITIFQMLDALLRSISLSDSIELFLEDSGINHDPPPPPRMIEWNRGGYSRSISAAYTEAHTESVIKFRLGWYIAGIQP